MSVTKPPMRWWGWGVDRDATTLPDRAKKELQTRFGLQASPIPAVALTDIPLPENQLSHGFTDALAAIAGQSRLSDNHDQRILRRGGKSYPDLLKMRLGLQTQAPDIVVEPSSAQQVEAILELCQREHVAVIPFGGGTSVVGGLDAQQGTCNGTLSLDLSALDRLIEVDPISRLATVEAGMRCYALEQALMPYGLTLGHFPQSFEYVSVGGCVATRSAGQSSTGYGRIDELVAGITMVSPKQRLTCHPMVRRAAGPELRELVIGSEGAFGVLTDITLKLAKRPEHRYYCGYMVQTFQAGERLCRDLAELDLSPTVVRLSDEVETAMTMLLSGSEGVKQNLVDRYLQLRHMREGCLLILGWEGSELSISQARKQCAAVLERYPTLKLGTKVGDKWRAHRFSGPYLRDELLSFGVFVETLETATTWRNIPQLYGAVRKALDDALREDSIEPIVMCHISHLYETGASLYFTFLAKQKDGEEALIQWQQAKDAACEAIIKNKGTISHHHAIGRDHARWLPAEIGEAGLQALERLKEAFDPTNIMNPGKLLEPRP